MKTLIAFVMLFGTSFASAAEVNATFYRIDMNLKLYEVCGTVVGVTSATSVDIEVDPGKYSGHYMTQTNASGKFCQIIRVFGNSVNVTAGNATLTLQTADALNSPNSLK